MDKDKELLNYLLFINLLSWGKYVFFFYIYLQQCIKIIEELYTTYIQIYGEIIVSIHMK